jgi:hypothetical protein
MSRRCTTSATAGQSLKDADSKAGPVRVTWGLVELWAEPKLCRETR